ncbi:polysaccharide biosynthesis/export family protein [Bremerella alba]|uniref:Polysaccharide export protein n=1 Tax=Bremerella alba TaxID=980252 RepID=A0A7V9A7M0_9BACT|nr:polysaccharide biosynthesis/export family protein [Bremerella alba]MBA2115418.1 hypothetical protein [Bremerella alba]
MLAVVRVDTKAIYGLLALCALVICSGCYAPLVTVGVPASTLPEEFRLPLRTGGPLLNFTLLTAPPPKDYLLGPEDVLEVTVPELFPNGEYRPLLVQVMGSGHIQLPLVGSVPVGGLNLAQAQSEITRAYSNGFFNSPTVSISLAQKATFNVVVLGKVAAPGVTELPRYENDVAHAIAQAGGLTEDAAEAIEIHRRAHGVTPEIVKIDLRGMDHLNFGPHDVILHEGDVVVVPNRRNEVFYVVGNLSPTNIVRFSAGERERELGGGFILPRDREVDVVTAVAMAGYIDPIESPTTVTVHRQVPGQAPMLIIVDLIKARTCREENINVCPGDIIYLNPDANWYFRRTFDRLVDDILLFPYRSVWGF